MKTPGYLLCVMATLLTAPFANAELTEAAAIEQGMAQPAIQSLLEAQQDQAEGERLSAGRWDNPDIEYSRESLDLRSGQSEETTWWVRQRLDLAGSKGLERDAAAMTEEAAETRVVMERRQWRARIREQFYDALAAQIRAQALTDHSQRLQRMATVIEQRVAQGDASRYDSLRMNQERTRAQSAATEAQARHRAQREQLFSLVGGDPERLGGALLPPAVAYEEHPLKQHPELKMLTALEQSATLKAKAARRAAWPEVSLGVGRKTLDEGGYSAEGNAIALSVEIPLFDRNEGDVQRARGLAHEYAADHALTHNRLRAQLRALRLTLAAQRESAQELRRAMNTGDDSLSAIAEASYQAGELSVMELVDAYRTELDTRLQYIDSARAARTTFIQLQQLEGQ
ncbi:TolC family protein [Marinimicrobium agarilyticum]|uniref:TolC family protein n=1 Tax=Marinimicrobium agarilyticum TaxID=306546 RepID=UPI0003FE192A|nr:TolC family protein [Marinimicrobium agarilyticum]